MCTHIIDTHLSADSLRSWQLLCPLVPSSFMSIQLFSYLYVKLIAHKKKNNENVTVSGQDLRATESDSSRTRAKQKKILYWKCNFYINGNSQTITKLTGDIRKNRSMPRWRLLKLNIPSHNIIRSNLEHVHLNMHGS